MKITNGITFKPKWIKHTVGWSALFKLKKPLFSIVYKCYEIEGSYNYYYYKYY